MIPIVPERANLWVSKNRSVLSIVERRRRSLPVLWTSVCALLMTAWAPTPGYAQAVRNRQPTPTPTLSSVAQRQQQMEEVYEGYARLFILGHILTKSFGVTGLMPNTMNLDVLAQQPLLAESGDVYVYRPSLRGDVMWPLVVPTPDFGSERVPTATPIPIFDETEDEATPTPTPSPTPTPIPPPPLKLQIVSLNQNAPLVMIGNTLLSLGDTIEGATVTQIGKHHAVVEYYGNEFYVTKEGTVAPEDFKEEEFLFN